MEIQTTAQGDIHVVQPKGRIDSANASQLEQALNTEFDKGATKVIIDLSELEYISSAGLRSVLLAGKRVRTLPGGKLILAGLRPAIREIFELSGFLAIFTVSSDLNSALTELA